MFSTAVLERAIVKEEENREKLRKQLLKSLIEALDKLAQEIPFDEAYIFGSVSRPYGFRRGSDLDIGFKGLNDENFFRAMSFISREVGVDNVDLVQLEGHRLEDKIKQEGIRWNRKG